MGLSHARNIEPSPGKNESQARLNKLVEKMVNKTKALKGLTFFSGIYFKNYFFFWVSCRWLILSKVYENNRKQEELKRKQMIEEKEMGIQSSQARLNNQKKFFFFR